MATKASNRWRLSIKVMSLMVALAVLAPVSTEVGVRPAEAGSGTPNDPWINEHVRWARANVFAIASGHRQELKATYDSVDGNFWASNVPFTNWDGFYYGIQTEGNLQGSQGGSPTRVAVFSVFARWGTSTYRILDSYRCSNGADGGGGVSCSRPYNWSEGTGYRFSLQITISNNSSLCPSGSPNACLVYEGYVGHVGFADSTLISRWSLVPNTYGDLSVTDHFVEDFSNPQPSCPHHPRGEFDYPTYIFGSTTATSPGLYYQADSGQPGECGRGYMMSFLRSNIRLVTP